MALATPWGSEREKRKIQEEFRENELEGKIRIGFGSDGLNSILGPIEIWALGSICEYLVPSLVPYFISSSPLVLEP